MSARLIHMKGTSLGVTPHGFGTSAYPCVTIQHFSRRSAGHFSLTIEEAAELARELAVLVMQEEAARAASVVRRPAVHVA